MAASQIPPFPSPRASDRRSYAHTHTHSHTGPSHTHFSMNSPFLLAHTRIPLRLTRSLSLSRRLNFPHRATCPRRTRGADASCTRCPQTARRTYFQRNIFNQMSKILDRLKFGGFWLQGKKKKKVVIANIWNPSKNVSIDVKTIS